MRRSYQALGREREIPFSFSFALRSYPAPHRRVWFRVADCAYGFSFYLTAVSRLHARLLRFRTTRSSVRSLPRLVSSRSRPSPFSSRCSLPFLLLPDVSDGAIVIFGSPGSIISNNTITAINVSRTERRRFGTRLADFSSPSPLPQTVMLGGINMVDYAPYSGSCECPTSFPSTLSRDS